MALYCDWTVAEGSEPDVISSVFGNFDALCVGLLPAMLAQPAAPVASKTKTLSENRPWQARAMRRCNVCFSIFMFPRPAPVAFRQTGITATTGRTTRFRSRTKTCTKRAKGLYPRVSIRKVMLPGMYVVPRKMLNTEEAEKIESSIASVRSAAYFHVLGGCISQFHGDCCWGCGTFIAGNDDTIRSVPLLQNSAGCVVRAKFI